MHDVDAARALASALAGERHPRCVAGGEADRGAGGVVRRRHGARRHRRRRRAALDAGRGARRQAHPAREQGGAGDRRRPRSWRRCAPAARRCCRSTASTTRSSSALTAAPGADLAHGVRRIVLTASGGPFRTRAVDDSRRRDAGGSLRPSQLVDGPQDLGRLGDDDEQGARGHRGALAVRRCRARRSRSSCIRRASSIRWSSTSTARCSRSSAAPTCACRSRTRSATPRASPAARRPLDLAQLAALTFEAPDLVRFPCLALAFDALEAGGAAPPC